MLLMPSQRQKTVGLDYSRIEYMRNIICECSMYGYCYITYSIQVYNKIHIQSIYSAITRKL